jgi:hypothetical protein
MAASCRAPGEKLRTFIQHFAAGVVVAVDAERRPVITKERRPVGGVIGFALGVLALPAVRPFAEASELRGSGGSSLIAAIGTDVFIGGLLIAARALGTVLAFGAAALMYLVTGPHVVRETPLITDPIRAGCVTRGLNERST